jgi:hypothetical protein
MKCYAVRNRNITAHCCVHLAQKAAPPYVWLSLDSVDILHERKQRTQLHWKRRAFLQMSLSRDWSHCPTSSTQSPKPFTTSYETISRKHQVTAFERPSLSPDLISEIVSFNSRYKSQWNGHFMWSGATWLLSEQSGVSRHSVSEQIG